MDIQFEKTLAILAGETAENFELKALDNTERTHIKNALAMMFQGYSLQEWLGGCTLGESWKKALTAVRNTVFEISTINTATQFARQQTFTMQVEWLQKLTTAAHTNTLIQCPDDKRGEWTADAKLKITTGMEMLLTIINSFASGTANAKKAPVDNVQTPIFQQIFDSRTEQERENVRERKMR